MAKLIGNFDAFDERERRLAEAARSLLHDLEAAQVAESKRRRRSKWVPVLIASLSLIVATAAWLTRDLAEEDGNAPAPISSQVCSAPPTGHAGASGSA